MVASCVSQVEAATRQDFVAQVAKILKSAFVSADVDNSGYLDLPEFTAIMASFQINARSIGTDMHTLLSLVDAGGSGSIEYDELVDFVFQHFDMSALLADKKTKVSAPTKALRRWSSLGAPARFPWMNQGMSRPDDTAEERRSLRPW